MHLEALNVFSATECSIWKHSKNTEANNFRAGRDLEDNMTQLPHFTDKARNKATSARPHSWLGKVRFSLL